MPKKWLAVVIVAVLFATLQFVPVVKTNPPVEPGRTLQARAQVSAAVAATFDRACKDCHSNETVWPWYSHLAPVSWLLSRDVREGRRELNFSDWARFDPGRADRKLQKICEEVRGGDMPLWFYRPLHPNSGLSQQDRQEICGWTDAERLRLKQSGH